MLTNLFLSTILTKLVQEITMPVSYNFGQKAKYRITLELDVMDDFNPHQIDWEKVLDVQGSERISAYVEDLSTPDVW